MTNVRMSITADLLVRNGRMRPSTICVWTAENLDLNDVWTRSVLIQRSDSESPGSIYTYIQSKISFTSSLISGILYTLLGIIILISPGSVVRSIAIGIGIVLSITGLSKVRLSFTLKEINTNWIGTLVIGVITTILGIVLIFNPFSGDAITKFAGAFLVIVAIFDLIDNYILQK